MDPSIKDLFPAFPPPIKTIIPMVQNNLYTNISEDFQTARKNINSFNESDKVLYQYLPITSSMQKTVEPNQSFNNEIPGSDFHQTNSMETRLQQASHPNYQEYPNGTDISKDTKVENISEKIEQFLKVTKQKFNSEVLKRHDSLRNRREEYDSFRRSDHRYPEQSTASMDDMIHFTPKFIDYDKPKERNRPKINSKKFMKKESFINLMDNSFDSILAKALEDVKNRKKSSTGQSFQPDNFSNFSINKDSFHKTNFPIENESVFSENAHYRDDHINKNSHEYGSDKVFGVQNNEMKLNMLSENNYKIDDMTYSDNSSDSQSFFHYMQNELAKEIVKFFTEEKVTNMTQLIQQEHSNLALGVNQQELKFSDMPRNNSTESCHDITTDNSYHFDSFGNHVESVNNSSANEQSDWDNMSTYTANMDISPKCSKDEKSSGTIGNKILADQSKRNKSTYDQENVHRYSSPEYESDYSSPNLDSPNRHHDFPLRNVRYSISPDVKCRVPDAKNHIGSSRNSFSNSATYRHYSFSPRRNKTYSKDRQSPPSYRKKRDQRDKRDVNIDKLRNYSIYHRTESDLSSLRNDITCDEKDSFLKSRSRSRSPYFNQFDHTNHRKIKLLSKGRHSSFSPRREKNIPDRKSYSNSNKRQSPFRISSKNDSKKYKKELSPSRDDRRHSNADEHYLFQINHSEKQRIKKYQHLSKRLESTKSSSRTQNEMLESPLLMKKVMTSKKVLTSSKNIAHLDKHTMGDNAKQHSLSSTKEKINKIPEKVKVRNKAGDSSVAFDCFELLKQQDYGAFADQFLSEFNRKSQNQKTIKFQKKLTVHERLGPQIKISTSEEKHHDDNRSHINSKRKIITYDSHSIPSEEEILHSEDEDNSYCNYSDNDLKHIQRTITNTRHVRSLNSPFTSKWHDKFEYCKSTFEDEARSGHKGHFSYRARGSHRESMPSPKRRYK